MRSRRKVVFAPIHAIDLYVCLEEVLLTSDEFLIGGAISATQGTKRYRFKFHRITFFHALLFEQFSIGVGIEHWRAIGITLRGRFLFKKTIGHMGTQLLWSR